MQGFVQKGASDVRRRAFGIETESTDHGRIPERGRPDGCGHAASSLFELLLHQGRSSNPSCVTAGASTSTWVLILST